MYFLPLVFEVYTKVFIGNLGITAEDDIKKHVLELTQSNILTLALMSAALSIFDFSSSLQLFLIIVSVLDNPFRINIGMQTSTCYKPLQDKQRIFE